MDSMTELDGTWFEQGEALAEASDEVYEEPARPNLLARFGLALAAAGVLVAALLGVARILV